MASKAKHERVSEAGNVLTRMCSINPTGLVFLTTKRFEISSELALTIQTNVPGITREWKVHGWVVECADATFSEELGHKITMLFSDLPMGLQQLLKLAERNEAGAFPAMPGAEIFGLN